MVAIVLWLRDVCDMASRSARASRASRVPFAMKRRCRQIAHILRIQHKLDGAARRGQVGAWVDLLGQEVFTQLAPSENSLSC